MVSEKKIVEIVDERRTTNDDGRWTTDIQGITKAHPEHSSGELIKGHTTSKLSYGEGRQRGIHPPMNPPKGTRASANEDWCRMHKLSQNSGANAPH